MPPTPISKKLRIVLIHGTFARNAAWALEGSPFRVELAKLLSSRGFEPDFEIFNWSGGNSHKDRIRAAKQLASYLAANPSSETRHDYCLHVAHSHGGNVSLLAHKHLPSCQHADGIVALGTPFVSVRKSLAAKDSNWRSIKHLLASFFVLDVFLFGSLLLGIPLLISRILEVFLPANTADSIGLIGGLVFVPFLLTAIFYAYVTTGGEVSRLLAGERGARSLMRAYRPATLRGTSILSIFYKSDEAKRYLGFLSLGVPLLDRALVFIAGTAVALVGLLAFHSYLLRPMIALAVPGAEVLGDWLLKNLWALPWPVISKLAAAITAGIVAVRLVSSVLKSNPFGFGWANPLAGLLLKIEVGSVPSGSAFASKELVVFDGPAERNDQLLHSGYFTDTRVAERIAKWVDQQFGS